MRAICITGMHRSGTSMISRIVNLLGVDLGADSDLMGPKPDNPTGFWESRSITALNDDLLAELGGSWTKMPALDAGWEHDGALEPYRERARVVLGELFGGSELIGWKDPRTSLLLPFWRTVVLVDRTILVVRDPRHVAASLAARDAMTEADAASLWLVYTLEAWHGDPKRIIARYDQVLSDPMAWAGSVCAELGLPPPSGAAAAAIEDFVKPGLRHHEDHTGVTTPEMTQALAVGRLLEDPDAESTVILEMLRDGHLEGRRRRVVAERLEVLGRHMDALQGNLAALEQHRDDLIGQRDAAIDQRTRLLGERDAARAAHATSEARLAAKDRAIETAERRLRSAGLRLESIEDALAETQRALGDQRRLGGSIRHHMSEIVRLSKKRARGAARSDRSPA